MATITLPHTIDNNLGEKLTFKEIIIENGEEKLLVENEVLPGAGPVMHTHWQQDESLTILEGKMGVRILGQEPTFHGPGETITFLRGTPHRFWNDGSNLLKCEGWISPPNDIVFFLDAVYSAMRKSGKVEPEPFDGAWLLTTYSSEYDMPEIPTFVKKFIMPLTVRIGKLLGKYDHFQNAPRPLPPIN